MATSYEDFSPKFKVGLVQIHPKVFTNSIYYPTTAN